MTKVLVGNIRGPEGPAGSSGLAGGDLTGYLAPKVTALTDGSSIPVDTSLGNVFTCTIAGNRTLANPTNLKVGEHVLFVITQDGTGGRTLGFASDYTWGLIGSAPTIDTTAGHTTILGFQVLSSSELRFTGAN